MSIDFSEAKRLALPIVAMGLVILASNHLVQIPIDYTLSFGASELALANWWTYGALSYPIAFLVTDTTNRLFGPSSARKVVWAGFGLGVLLSMIAGDMRIALASGTAFLTAQMMDVFVFDRLRQANWWKAPVLSSLIGSSLDTALFFSLAFYGTGLPWVSWAFGDMAAKVLMIALLLYPFKLITMRFENPSNRAAA